MAQNDPDWSVDPGDFQYSMTIVASLRLSNEVSDDPKDRIGVFVGDELRGTGFLNITVPSTGTLVAFIQVYSNQVSGESLSFRVYDDSEDLVLTAVNTETFLDTKKLGENLDPFEVTDNSLVTDLSLSITAVDENASAGTVAATISHNDPDQGQTHTFSLASGEGDTNNSDFSISGNQLTLNASYDHETDDEVSIRLKVVDSKNGAYEEQITLEVNDKNDTPTQLALSQLSIAENSASGTAIGDFSSTDQDESDSHTYTLADGDGADDNSLFQISGDELQVKGELDFETKSNLSIRVRTTDVAGAFHEQTFQIGLTDTNDAPTDLILSNSTISENAGDNKLLGELTTSDPDNGDAHVYSFVSGTGDTDNGLFAIRNDNELYATASFNFEQKSSYTIRLVTTDKEGATHEESFTVSVSDSNDGPTDLAISNNTLPENAAIDDLLGELTATDEDSGDTHTFELTGGDGDQGNALFKISGTRLLLNASLDFETASEHSVRMKVTDQSGSTYEKVLSVNVSDVNDAPTAISLSATDMDENNALNDLIGTLSTSDQDSGDSHSYQLVSGTGDEDNASFEIANTGELLVKKVFDFESQASYSLRVRSTDQGGLTIENSLNIVINDINEPGTDIALSSHEIDENGSVGTVIGTLNTADEDNGETFTYALISGDGSTDNSSFELDGDQLKSLITFDHETQESASIRVRSTDSEGHQLEEVFLISITDKNDAPTDLTITNNVLAEDAAIDEVIGDLSATDEDSNETHSFDLVSGDGDDGNALFKVVGTQLLLNASLDFETAAQHSVRLKVTDKLGAIFEKALLVNVTDVNDAPTAISLSSAIVDENNAANDLIGALSTSDQDSGDSHSYQLVSGIGDEDNASFEIGSNGQLLAKKVFDFEQQAGYSLRVRSTDQGGLSVESSIEVAINDVNEVGTVISLSSNLLNENSVAGTVIGTFHTTDEDDAETFVYSLVSGEGSDDNDSFELDGNTLKSLEVLDHENQSAASIRVRSTDSKGNQLEETFSIVIKDENESPSVLSLSDKLIDENLAQGAQIGTLSTTDVDEGESFIYSFVTGEGDDDNGTFTIQNDVLYAVTSFDFETKPSYKVRIASTDQGGLSVAELFTITVTDKNDAPTALSLSENSLPENNSVGAAVGTFSTADEDATDSHSYSLVTGTGDDDNASFEIDESGVLSTKVAFNFEANEGYSIRVRSTDGGAASIESTFTINVTDVNEVATAIDLSANELAENKATGSLIGTFSTTDPDAEDTFTYSLVAGEGDEGNDSFQIDGADLESALVFDHEAQDALSIRVRSTDNEGNTLDEVFNIAISDVNEDPTSFTLSQNTVVENSPGGTVVGLLAVEDQDEDDPYVFVLKTGISDNLFFGVNGGNQIVVAGALDFESQNSFEIAVQAIDSDGRRFEEQFTINIENELEPGIDVSKSEFDFGQVGVGESAAQEFTIDNTGPDGILRITSVDLPEGFRVDPATAEVQPGEQITLNLFFEPSQQGPVEDVITINSNAGNVEVTVLGQANLVTSIEAPVDLSEEVSMGPNPAMESVTLDMSVFNGRPYSVNLIDQQGHVLMIDETGQDSKYVMTVTGMTPGLYIVLVRAGGHVARKKLIIR